MSADSERYHRDVAAWASARGWTYHKGAGGRAWRSRLPRGTNSDVELQVDGTHDGHPCTLVYIDTTDDTMPPVQVELTVVVVYLPSAHPAAEIKRRRFSAYTASSAVGHAAFDKRFRVHTSAPGGPAAVICTQLAEAHVAGEVPLWSLREHELMCHTDGKIRIENLNATLNRAVRVAKLLGIAQSPTGRQLDGTGPLTLGDRGIPGRGASQDAHIRISHAERDQAISMLGVHLSTGRLELTEFEDRCGKAATARTKAEVELLFGDLPAPHPDLSLAARPALSIQGPGQLAGKDVSSKQTSDLSETPLSSAMEVIAGVTILLGIPGAIAVTIWMGAWWMLLLVFATTVLAGGLAEAFKKPKP